MAVCSRNTASSSELAGISAQSPSPPYSHASVTVNGFSTLFTNCLANLAPHRTLSSHPLHLNVPSVWSGWVPQPQLGNIPDAQSLVTVYANAAELSAYTNDCSLVPITHTHERTCSIVYCRFGNVLREGGERNTSEEFFFSRGRVNYFVSRKENTSDEFFFSRLRANIFDIIK